MGRQLNRIVSVTFGKAGTIGTKVTGLFTQFDIGKNSETNPNTSNIRVTNMNESSRSALQEKGIICRLDTGYSGVTEQLFLGDVNKAESARQGTDWVTTINLGDGQAAIRDKRINVSLGPGATFQQVIETLTTELNVGIGTIKGLIGGFFEQGVVLEGQVSDRLTDMLQKMGLVWSIQDGNIQITPPDQPTELTGVLVSSTTGMLGSPTKTDKGVKVRMLLRPKLKPGVAFELLSNELRGLFKVNSMSAKGDSRRGTYETEVMCTEVPTDVIITSDTLNIATSFVGFA